MVEPLALGGRCSLGLLPCWNSRQKYRFQRVESDGRPWDSDWKIKNRTGGGLGGQAGVSLTV